MKGSNLLVAFVGLLVAAHGIHNLASPLCDFWDYLMFAGGLAVALGEFSQVKAS